MKATTMLKTISAASLAIGSVCLTATLLAAFARHLGMSYDWAKVFIAAALVVSVVAATANAKRIRAWSERRNATGTGESAAPSENSKTTR